MADNPAQSDQLSVLEKKIRILEQENEQLTEHAEDTLLLAMISEEVNTLDNPDDMIKTGLEKVSMLKDVPLVLCCRGEVISQAFLSFSHVDITGANIRLSEHQRVALHHDSINLSGAACAGLLDLPGVQFEPSAIMVISFTLPDKQQRIFLFADDKADLKYLERNSVMLHRVVDLIAMAASNCQLLHQFQDLNEELEQKVSVRTKALENSNRQLAQTYEASLSIMEDLEMQRASLRREIDHRQETEAALQALVRTTAEQVGESFFHGVVAELAHWLEADCVILSVLPDQDHARALAMIVDGEFVENYAYSLAGTPCENAVHKGYCEYREGTSDLFPEDTDLVQMGIEAYIGVPLKSVDANTVGIICALARKKDNFPPNAREVLEIVAARSVAEIERQTALDNWQQVTDELKAKNRELDRFAYTVSHDLKAPMLTINGFLGQMEKDIAGQKQGNVQDDIRRIRSATEKMRQLLEGLLELSRIGRIINPPEDVALNELVNEALVPFAAIIAESKTQVKINERLSVIRADRPRLLQVYENLIGNALKYSVGSDKPVIKIGTREGKTEAIYFVRDNGMGIKPDLHEKVFELFVKLDAKSKGTGIGLALCKRIIEAHGGHIWVESEGNGKGSMFCFTLPQGERSEH